jgi:cell division protein FtsB
MIYVIFILLALLGACAAALAIQAKRARAYKADAVRLCAAVKEASRMAERRGALEAKKKKLEEGANEMRKELDETADAGLVRRADDLFGGMPDGSKQSGA